MSRGRERSGNAEEIGYALQDLTNAKVATLIRMNPLGNAMTIENVGHQCSCDRFRIRRFDGNHLYRLGEFIGDDQALFVSPLRLYEAREDVDGNLFPRISSPFSYHHFPTGISLGRLPGVAHLAGTRVRLAVSTHVIPVKRFAHPRIHLVSSEMPTMRHVVIQTEYLIPIFGRNHGKRFRWTEISPSHWSSQKAIF